MKSEKMSCYKMRNENDIMQYTEIHNLDLSSYTFMELRATQ